MPPLAHSPIGASSAYRWMQCSGSIELLRNNPMPTNSAATEGTRVHDLCEQALHDIAVEYTSDKDEESVEGYRRYVKDIVKEVEELEGGECIMLVEEKFNLKTVADNAFGTCDCAVYQDFGPLHVIDYKNGRNPVNVKGNTQLMYYALGIIESQGIMPSEIVLHVYQPNSAIETQTSQRWATHMETLKDFEDELIIAAARVNDNPDVRMPGDWCVWCNKAACPECRLLAQETAMVSFDDIETVPDISAMPTESIEKILAFEGILSGIIKDAHAVMYSRTEAGEQTGYKVVEKKGHTKWKKGVDIESLGDDLYDKKYKTPTQVKKLLKGKKEMLALLEEMTERPITGTKLVKESAEGTPVKLDSFEDIS